MEASSSSKVTVEYHDPASVFSLVSREIQSRLPLRNLNWQSPPRPLRQIKHLHVDFVPDQETESLRHPVPSRPDSGSLSSIEIVRGGLDLHKNVVKERRHQIPGLKTSAYLKIYVLRCDDKDVYKEVERKRIREWVKENALPEGRRENHDAFEWMILHVVIPDTIAASEPRWREGASKDTDELRERKTGGAKWPGKGSRTVFDRLRGDFNEGKSGQDRVAQIRVVRDRVPPDLLPTPAMAPTLEESPQERENAWNDLIGKFKVLILGSFDRRVRQYEADIAEQEARRSFPGWNFCTFFIHKEGLAKALESIGLVEDALAIYDELSLGLETIMRMIASGEAQGTATSFASYTDDMITRVAGSHSNGANHDVTNDTHDAHSLFSKDYREKIVRSDISIFDFLCYLFTREKALILRLANTRAARLELDASSRQEGGEDLVLASEVCWRASSFIHNATRTLRQDLINSPLVKGTSNPDMAAESVVCSWTYAVAGQVLEETAVPVFLNVTKFETSNQSPSVNGKPKRPVSTMALGANPYPQRTTSLTIRKADIIEALRQPAKHTPVDATRPPSSSETEVTQPTGLPGQAELATYRAELILLRRKMLEKLAMRRGWYAGWAWVKQERSKELENVSLDDDGTTASTASDEQDLQLGHQLSPFLRTMLESEDTFQAEYAQLTNLAIRHYFAATQSKSAEVLIGDLAILRYQQSDYTSATAYFEHVLPFFAADSWSQMEAEALVQYAHCLRKTQRNEDYVQVVLKLMAKVCERKMEPDLPRLRLISKTSVFSDEMPNTTGMMQDLVTVSESLAQASTSPLNSYFADVKLDHEVRHAADADITILRLQLRHVLDEPLSVDCIIVRLTSMAEDAHAITFATSRPVLLEPGVNIVELESRTVTTGEHIVERVEVNAKKLRFVQEVRPKPSPLEAALAESTVPTHIAAAEPPEMVYLYPANLAFNVEVRPSRNIHIDRPRCFDVVLNSGRNRVLASTLQLKPLSAGLRLHLGDVVSVGARPTRNDSHKPGKLSLEAFGPEDEFRVSVPYTIEQAVRHITVHVEVRYTTPIGDFDFGGSAKLLHELPLDVDVNDIFHIDALFSNFTLRTTSQTPVTVVGADLAESPVYSVQAPPTLQLPLTVFRSRPMKLLYRIARTNESNAAGLQKKDAALALRVQYRRVEVVVQHLLRSAFTKQLAKSRFTAFARLLTPLLLARSSSLIPAAGMEMAALLGEAAVPTFDEMGWPDIVSTLSTSVQEPLLTWLRKWHVDNAVLDLKRITEDEAPAQQITISVDVPSVDVVFDTILEPQNVNRPLRGKPPILVVGQPINALLRIRHTSRWSAKNIFPHIPRVRIQSDSSDAGSTFAFDVAPDAKTWLVGGPRRSRLVADDGGEQTFSLLLIPLRVGCFPLPHVEVQVESAGDASIPGDAPALTCATHCKSAGQLVDVVDAARTRRVRILEPLAGAPSSAPPSRPGTASSSGAG